MGVVNKRCLNVPKYTSDLSSDVLCFLFLSPFFLVCIEIIINSDNNNNNNEGCMRNTKVGRTPFPRSLKSSSKRHRVCSRKHPIDIRPYISGKDYRETSKNLFLSLSLSLSHTFCVATSTHSNCSIPFCRSTRVGTLQKSSMITNEKKGTMY